MRENFRTIIVAVLLCITTSWAETLFFRKCSTHTVNEQTTYTLEWYGNVLSHYSGHHNCTETFHGYHPSNAEREYKVCVKTEKLEIRQWDVYLGFYGDDKNTIFYYRSSALSEEWCSGDDYLKIKLTTGNGPNLQGRISLQIYAKRVYLKDDTSPALITTICGVLSGILVLLGIVITFMVVAACRRKSRQTVMANHSISGNRTTLHSGTQQMTAGYNHTYSTVIPPPPYYPPTNTSFLGTTSQDFDSPPPYQPSSTAIDNPPAYQPSSTTPQQTTASKQ